MFDMEFYRRCIRIACLLAIPILFISMAEGASTPGSGLNSRRIELLQIKALQGDGDAAMRLHEYYSVFAIIPQRSAKWLMIAAEDGNQYGQLEVGYLLSKKPQKGTFDAVLYGYIFSMQFDEEALLDSDLGFRARPRSVLSRLSEYRLALSPDRTLSCFKGG